MTFVPPRPTHRLTEGPTWESFCDKFGLDDFQRIAVAEISRGLDRVDPDGTSMPQPGSEHAALLAELVEVVFRDPDPGSE